MTTQTEIFLFYLVIIIVFTFIGSKTQYENGMAYGCLLGIVISGVLWQMYGKRMVESNVRTQSGYQ